MTRAPVPGLGLKLARARLALWWESAWPAFWPVAAVIGLFILVALSDIMPRLPALGHWAVLAVFALALIGALWRGLRAWRWADRDAARRRIEIASGAPHRPLTALNDTVAAAGDDPLSAALWQAHLARARAALKALRVGWPRPGLASRDPFALRALMIVLVASAAVMAGEDAPARLWRAVEPGRVQAASVPGQLDLWITPPAYTNLPPLLPQLSGETEIAVPAGSAILAQVNGGGGRPALVIDGTAREFETIDGGNYRLSGTINDGARLEVRQSGAVLGGWNLRIIPDAPPTANLLQAPSRTQRAALRLEYAARDDYGVADLRAVIRRPNAEGQIEIALPLNQTRAREADGASYHDLTAHPWAGLPVVMRLIATDTSGQNGQSEEIALVLPERTFSNAVARAIIEQRRTLVGDPSLREAVAVALNAIAAVPGQYGEDLVVFLALRSAAARLVLGDTPATIDAVQALLWDTALRIEDGNVSLAERELRALQQQLRDAIARNAPDAEIERLIQELRQAIDRYLQAMAEQARRNPQANQRERNERQGQRVERQDLQRMLDQARQMARTGARDQARDLLQRLQDMLENLRMQQQGQQAQGEGEGEPGEGETGQMLQNLQELMDRQQRLTDRTFRRSQQGRPGQTRPGQNQGLNPGQQPGGRGEEVDGDDSAEQEGIRRELGEAMRQLGEMMGDIPGGFGRAERAMRESAEQLGRGQPNRALRPQMDALNELRAGAAEMLRRMQEQANGEEGEGGVDPSQQQDAEIRDPAGRPLNNGGNPDTRDVRVPNVGEGELQRSREILEELMRRAGERFRPRLERDYIDRLLRRF